MLLFASKVGGTSGQKVNIVTAQDQQLEVYLSLRSAGRARATMNDDPQPSNGIALVTDSELGPFRLEPTEKLWLTSDETTNVMSIDVRVQRTATDYIVLAALRDLAAKMSSGGGTEEASPSQPPPPRGPMWTPRCR